MSNRRTAHLPVAWLPLCLLVTAAAPALAGTALKVDPANPHYLNYNDQTLVLVGMSSEFLPHVTRLSLGAGGEACSSTMTPPSSESKECNFDNLSQCINTLRHARLNKMQLWIAPNSSKGRIEEKSGKPYCHEQPFLWTGRGWQLDNSDPVFLKRVLAVLDAANPDILVEVNLFDQWNGFDPHSNPCTFSSSPWTRSNNAIGPPASGVSVQFSDTKYMTAYDAVDHQNQNGPNYAPWQQQKLLVKQMVSQLNSRSNFYWQIANEPDLIPGCHPALRASDITAMIKWHTDMADLIAAQEGALPKQHLIGVNFTSTAALNQIASQIASGSHQFDHIGLVNGHYAGLSTEGGSSAIQMARKFTIGRALGFNEGRSTPCPTLIGSRAEAWEFMLNEGAVYDNYNLGIFARASDTVRSNLGALAQFLNGLNLAGISGNQRGSRPNWTTSTFPAYPTTPTVVSTYWGAMEWPDHQYVVYLHNSTLSQCAPQQRYIPKCNQAGYQNSFGVKLGRTGYYKAEWFWPDNMTPVCTTSLHWTGGAAQVSSPRYIYDIALRISICPNNGASPCASPAPCPAVRLPPCFAPTEAIACDKLKCN
ncbi:MAG: hypothetical protein M3O15_08610 [Acidobacteriota bacterium]|nr:hypothetical protein [Acidobacteriota bacterium]